MRPLLFLFLDGIGVSTTEQNNPISTLFHDLSGVTLLQENLPVLNSDLLLKSIDPILGVKGTPQSATGQTTLMTGINSQKEIGFHQTAFPGEGLMTILKQHNLLSELKEMGLKVTCANLYSREYFTRRRERRKNMFPVSALSVMYADLPFRFIEEYNNGKALFADITNNRVKRRGWDIEEIKAKDAAERMASICKENDFIFFEYFLTDSLGHKRDTKNLEFECNKLNSFIKELWREGGFDIIITSDHGNAEDCSIANHTLNPVPFLFLTRNLQLKKFYSDSVNNITHVKEVILHYFR